MIRYRWSGISLVALLGGLASVLACSHTAAGASDPALEFRPRQVLRGPVRAITNAPVVPAAQATADIVRDNELVLGVVVHGQARAYPLNQLTGPSREIINDRLGGEPIAATW